ncbi:proline racemase family protein [Pseudalkalibacillus salsuginis]|uniref:proline racemase family protein n=1 Tax=Pseudalkalibacillus salsuginis TaxID=2910972 RepID=UPI001F2AA9AA|nr:proline racemase family protein [Pseudalkalibacillus salsuginis]MCF6410026.1 proline racemase family protein [Pseudalkalibacillus salsuginis]
MKADRLFTTIDTHTGGNPTRTVISGLPKLDGRTMADKMLHMKHEYDWIRKFLMYEPRGHEVMSGALMVEPCHPDADIGVIFIETGGYLPMCGHDTIGFCTALVETGMIKVKEPKTELTLDTPAGLVKVTIQVNDGHAEQVTFCNVPSFLLKSITVYVPTIGEVDCDIAYGGNFYAITDAQKIGLPLVPSNASNIIDTAVQLRDAINHATEVVHPESSFIKGLTHIEFFSEPSNPAATVKNTVVVPPGGIDRSPCGTGTSAKLATLYAHQKIEIGEPFIHESIVGTLFRGKILEKTNVGGFSAVLTEISGRAWIMGKHTFFSNVEDELNEGFLLIPPMEGH